MCVKSTVVDHTDSPDEKQAVIDYVPFNYRTMIEHETTTQQTVEFWSTEALRSLYVAIDNGEIIQEKPDRPRTLGEFVLDEPFFSVVLRLCDGEYSIDILRNDTCVNDRKLTAPAEGEPQHEWPPEVKTIETASPPSDRAREPYQALPVELESGIQRKRLEDAGVGEFVAAGAFLNRDGTPVRNMCTRVTIRVWRHRTFASHCIDGVPCWKRVR